MSYKDKVVFITGGSSGIGESLARQFHERGARLVLASNEPEELDRVKDELGGGDRIVTQYLDLSDIDAIEELVKEAYSRFGHVDVLVNNGGISQRSLVKDTSMETYKRIMNIDFLGHVAVTRAVLPSMLERKSGHIVVTSSVTGRIGAPLRSGYAAAKHALHGFFDTLRAEVHADNIKVTVVCPTSVRTNISYNAVTGDGKQYGRMSDHLDKGLTAGEAAARIIKAMNQGKEEVIIGDDFIKHAILVKRLFPGLFSTILRKAKVN